MVSSRGTVGGLLQRTKVGRKYRAGARRPVLLLPGATNTTDSWFFVDDVLGGEGEVGFLTRAGFPVGSTGTLDLWGNSTHRTNIATLKTNMQASLAAAGKAHLWGISAGGLGALNFAKYNPTLVQSLCLVIPAIDVQAIHAENRSGFAAVIETAYGGAPADADNPADNTADFAGIPIRIYGSLNDTVGSWAEAEAFADATGAELISMGALGHLWGAPYASDELLAWVLEND